MTPKQVIQADFHPKNVTATIADVDDDEMPGFLDYCQQAQFGLEDFHLPDDKYKQVPLMANHDQKTI